MDVVHSRFLKRRPPGLRIPLHHATMSNRVETETDRQTDRQTVRDRQKQSETDRYRQIQTVTDRDRQRHSDTETDIGRLRQTETSWPTARHMRDPGYCFRQLSSGNSIVYASI